VDLDATAVTGIWWRHTPHGGDPLFRADPPADGRWQRGETVAALYFADSEQTAWAEWYRALAEFAIPPLRQMPRDLWRWRLDASGIADLSDEGRLRAVGLPLPRPTVRQWPAFQAVGERVWRDGYRGVLAPSAARPDGRVLCLFREAVEVPGAEPERPPATHRHPPPPPTGMTT
jgi:RES domain-containing protein